jgi:hypothetical protein
MAVLSDLAGIASESKDWVKLAQFRFQWRPLTDIVRKLWIS